MTRAQLAETIKKTALLKGNFTLRSGKTATEYFDKYRIESSPVLLKQISAYLKEFIPTETQVLAGLEMGGVPLVTALSLESGLPCVFVRKKHKEYGTKQITEGVSIKNKKVCIIEDVITTGGQVIKSALAMRKEKALISHVICMIYRGEESASEKLKSHGLFLSAFFTWNS